MAPQTLLTALAAFTSIAAAASSAGCGKTRPIKFTDRYTITSGNQTRTFGVYVPVDYNTNTSFPRRLIVDYHGHNGSPAGQFNNSQYYAYPGGGAYLAVYPAGLDAAWQGASYARAKVNDTQFTADLLDYMEANYCVDTNRIYASGKSNGGGFVDTLACTANPGNRFAAYAMASSALYTDQNQTSCSIPRAILQAHGGDDTVIPYGGCQNPKNPYCPESGGVTPNVTTWTTWWGVRDGCTASQKNTTLHTGYQTQTFSCKNWTNVVQHLYIYDLGHCWPSTSGNNTDGDNSGCNQANDHVLDFTPRVLSFYDKWTVSNAPK